ncbi:MAG TPA: prolyl oligopeptidase family serine peptidase [Streptosporangiaceae bacterium]
MATPRPDQPAQPADQPAHLPDQAADPPSYPRQAALTRRFTLGAPRAVTISGDGGMVFFLRSRGGTDPVSCLWALDCRTWAERLLADPARLLAGASEELSPQEQTRRERGRLLSAGIVSYAACDSGRVLAFSLSGQLWTVRSGDGHAQRLPAREPVLDPRPDPGGARIAYVSEGALRVIEADGQHDRALAVPDGPDITFGLPEHVAAESMGRDRGYWWAPDGNRLLVARADTRGVQRWYVPDPANPVAEPAVMRYPAAGTANADVSLWIAEASGPPGAPLTPVAWDRAALEYLTAAGWDGAGAFAAVQSRDQQTVHVLSIDPGTGASQVAAVQTDRAWVTLVPGLPARSASGTLLTSADVEDTRRLLADGEPVTPPGLQLEAVTSVDGETVAFTASADDPAQISLWLYEAGAGIRPLSPASGVHDGMHRAGTTVLISASQDWLGTRVTVRAPQGSGSVTSLAQEPVVRPRMELLSLGPRGLRAALFLPSWHQPGDPPLPVLMDPYGGPAARKVLAGLDSGVCTSQWFADQGFAVLTVDGRGTPGRGPAWERAIYLDLAGPVLDDQVEGLQAAAAARPGLDLSRVGIRGWSFGGYLAALAVLRRPDVFHAAVAGAPPTDQRMYDTHWRERHMGHPAEHPEVYDRCSLIADAPALTRPLLLIHGLADDNVFPLHTLRLSAALLAAGRLHEVLPLPGITHAAGGSAIAENMLWHQLGFLRRSLGLSGSPRVPSPPANTAPDPAVRRNLSTFATMIAVLINRFVGH